MNDHGVRLTQHCPVMDATPFRVDLERVISRMYPPSIVIIAYFMILSILQGFETSLTLDYLSVFRICDRYNMSVLLKIN